MYPYVVHLGCNQSSGICLNFDWVFSKGLIRLHESGSNFILDACKLGEELVGEELVEEELVGEELMGEELVGEELVTEGGGEFV